MNRHRVRAAIELIDVAPSIEFRATLRAQLLAEFPRPDQVGMPASEDPNAASREAINEYVTLKPNQSRFFPERRLSRTLAATAACVAVLATVAAIINSASHDATPTVELHDVDQPEASRLAQRALIPGEALGLQWSSGQNWAATELPNEAAATIAALPDCAQLRSVGLMPPTTKSATAYQYVSDNNLLLNQVFVFATREDASRAMNVIAGDVFPTCWFDVFDRGVEFTYPGVTSTSEEWEPPQIAQHGDRQVIIGQHTQLTLLTGPAERDLVVAFVQVGRAITLVNPRVLIPGELFSVNKDITAATDALHHALGT